MIAYINHWYGERSTFKKFLLIRYEDLHKNKGRHFITLLTFLGVYIDRATLKMTLEFSSFENMRDMEKNNVLGTSLLSAPSHAKKNEEYHTREGAVGGFKQYLTDIDCVYACEAIKKLNSDFDYRC